MRRVIHPGSAFVRDASLFVTGIQLVKAGAHATRLKQTVLAAVDHHERCRHRQRRHIRIVEVAIQAGHELREADAISNVLSQLSWERGHPSDGYGCLDTVIQSS